MDVLELEDSLRWEDIIIKFLDHRQIPVSTKHVVGFGKHDGMWLHSICTGRDDIALC